MDNYKLQRCGLLREDADIVSPNHLGSSSFITNGGKYYYHSYYLGSSTLITDGTGFISQQVEYLPYGEVFLEKQRNEDDYLSPYRFNGKELDEETGLYYYGARYMNPRLSIWYATDPMQEKYPNVSSYCYTFNNPIRNNLANKKGHLSEENKSSSSQTPKYSKEPPGKLTKLRGGQGWRDKKGLIWKRDMKHKNHYDVTDPKTGKKVKEVDYNGKQIWPNSPKNKNKK